MTIAARSSTVGLPHQGAASAADANAADERARGDQHGNGVQPEPHHGDPFLRTTVPGRIFVSDRDDVNAAALRRA